jgi:putative ABC transport system substrate-binding protein
MPIIGFLDSSSADEYAPFLAAFRSGLNEAGFIEGRNVAIEYRWADARYDRLPALAAELVRIPVAVLVATGITAAVATKAATATIPIVSTRAATRSGLALSRASTGREEMSPVLPRWAKSSSQSGLSCCVRWFPRLTRSPFL